MKFEDPILNAGDQMFQILDYNRNRKNLLLYLSCHGRTMMDYFATRMDLREEFNIMRLETGPMKLNFQNGINVLENEAVLGVLDSADAVITYNMGPRHGPIALENVEPFFNRSAKVITVVAPNCSCFWPWALGYGADIGVTEMLDGGATEQDVWSAFEMGSFDPKFNIRWRLEMGRLVDKEAYHDVALAGFVMRNYKEAKLWLASPHPSFVTMAYLGAKAVELLGMDSVEEHEFLDMDPMVGAMNGVAETNYEFDHYGFKYPMRHGESWGGLTEYRSMLTNIVNYHRAGGLIMPAHD